MEIPDDITPHERVRVIDARGKTRHLCPASKLSGNSPRGLRWALLVGARHRWVAWAQTIVVLVFSAMSFYAAFGSRKWTSAQLLVNIAYAIVLVLALFFTSKRVMRIAGKRAVAACLRAEVCPACGYSLRGLVVSEDGVRVCPECGGAWRVIDDLNADTLVAVKAE
jgi:hypothetical protein